MKIFKALTPQCEYFIHKILVNCHWVAILVRNISDSIQIYGNNRIEHPTTHN